MGRGAIGCGWAVVCALLFAAVGCDSREASGRPRCVGCNLLLVTFDALRADHLGAWGYARDTSPQLDAFARESYVFTAAMAQSGSTVNSLPSLFTARYPFVDGILGTRPLRLVDDETTLAELLREHGYHTAATIGWRFAGSRFGLAQGFDVFDEDMTEDEPAARTVARATALLGGLRRPFFLWIHLRPPHTPYAVSDAEFQRFHPQRDEPTLQTAGVEEVLAHSSRTQPVYDYVYDGKQARLTVSMVEQLEAQYDANIRGADAAFGSLLAFLGDAGRAADTLVVVASDHGESMGEHRLVGHNRLYHGVLHTPLMLRVPGAGGGVSDRPVMNVDLLPTLLGLLEVPDAERRRGRDLFEAVAAERFQFAEYENARSVVLHGRYKLLIRRGEKPTKQLFDLAEDPGEQVDVASEQPRIAAELVRLATSLKSLEDAEAPLLETSESLEALRELGYITSE